jgi:hypothetical protein
MREELINIALKEVGYKEGKNNATKYGHWYGLDNNPWCAMFVSWCSNKAGIGTNIIPKYAGCGTGWKWFKKKGLTSNSPQRGDIVFFKPTIIGATSSHTGIVVDVSDDYVYTVEGNSGTNTDGVYKHTYKKNYSKFLGFAHPAYLGDTYSGNYPTLPSRGYFKKGDTGANVKLLQQLLNWINGDKLVVDGIIGNKTINSVKKFQKNNALVVDGLFGKKSLSKAKEVRK